MSCLRMAAVLSLLFGPLLPGSADAMARKCKTTPGGIAVRNATPLVIVNGEVMDDSLALQGIKREEILAIEIVCLEVMEAGVRVGRSAIAVITRPGAMSFMKSHLQDLVRQQDAYRARTGEYARNLASLDFFATRAPLPIEMQLRDGGWSAKVELATAIECQVVVETAKTGPEAPAVACTQI